MPSFHDFYEAVNGRAPFPWQTRLARHVADEQAWPSEIGVPTGLGKTACLDIAVWWLASQADLAPSERTAPTRIWWVVNRRLLVDAASEHAQLMSAMLDDPADDGRSESTAADLSAVATRLLSVGGSLSERPLQVIPMRGGLTLRRPTGPAQPAVIVSTIPMYGSRLLFRGYGSSRSMRPIDAALAGTDSLVLVDEAHLATHLRELIPKLAECIDPSVSDVLPGRRRSPQVVSLTATGDQASCGRFDLDEADRGNPVVRQRLDAPKPIRIDSAEKGDPARALCASALELLDNAETESSCVVFCNTPATARDVFNHAKGDRRACDFEIVLVTGRTRQADADRLRLRLMSPIEGAPALSGDRPRRQRSLLVIATQTLEVGADLDFEFLVTEQCGVRALTQRLGRLNRLGRFPHAEAVYVHRPPKHSRSSPKQDGWPVYGTEPNEVLDRLTRNGVVTVNLSPREVACVLGKPRDAPGRAPEILPDLLWEWIKTTTPPHGEAPVEPYFAGVGETQRTVAVLWRAFVPSETELQSSGSGDVQDRRTDTTPSYRLWPRIAADETIDIPVWEARDALEERGIDMVLVSSDGQSWESVHRTSIRPGHVVVLLSDAGLCDDFGWAPEEREPVIDVSIRRSGLPLNVGALRRILNDGSGVLAPDIDRLLDVLLDDDEESLDDSDAIEAGESLIAALRLQRDVPGFDQPQWHAFLDGIDAAPARPPNEVFRLAMRRGDGTPRIDEFDEGSIGVSLPAEARELLAHGNAVGQVAERAGTALGLPARLADVIRSAGTLHDIGKADERFQCWLDPAASRLASSTVPLAKSVTPRSRWSAARRASGWPFGGRHEELSGRLVKAWLAQGGHGLDAEECDLLTHLVMSHHGKGRPMIAPVADGPAQPVTWTFQDGAAVTVEADLSCTDWSQPSRFRRLNERFGPWGLALLEAIVRQADHQVSSAVRGDPGDDFA
ncbi:MAG: type I-U CRISPR-associated helicase/endonuclease Cas3 [Acidimicrobiaceae bacterium]|nr:type I-U CRISPR-associated helicase/endonuclease Cas3 [Acidimicrobiaceae bacterium]MYE09161.1 type I-U CRISPR-associated helicase/endonuclease Cas3 [Acidimicrobiaceae bacterium]